MSAFEKLKQYAIEWKINGYTIVERWNPDNSLAKLYGSSHPDADKKLYAILNHFKSVYSKKRNCFVYEPSPSCREDDFILDTRFILEEAFYLVHNIKTK